LTGVDQFGAIGFKIDVMRPAAFRSLDYRHSRSDSSARLTRAIPTFALALAIFVGKLRGASSSAEFREIVCRHKGSIYKL
jgi:hypothetical protein